MGNGFACSTCPVPTASIRSSIDEQVVCDVLFGRRAGEPVPDMLVAVVDATNLRQHLRLVLGLKRLGRPLIVALNMVDLARKRGLDIDTAALARELGVPVVETVAVRADGSQRLAERLEREVQALPESTSPAVAAIQSNTLDDHREVQRILVAIGADRETATTLSDRIDRVLLHPVLGVAILGIVLFLIFQAVFSWAQPVMNAIDAGVSHVGAWLAATLPAGPLRSLLTDGVVAGVGSVLVFLPQIVILFFFILLLEDSGYLPRAAFLLDRLMGGVGLSGRSFIPLLSSFACAIPGIMATRTIPSARDRLVTIMVAPLMTCSARLPVYALLIAAFIPALTVGRFFELQGLVLFVLYVAGVAGAMLVAWVLKLRELTPLDPGVADGTACVSLAKPQEPAHRLVATRRDLPDAGGHDHSFADDPALVPKLFPGPTARRAWTGDRIQHGRTPRRGVGRDLRADRFQLEDLYRAGGRAGGSRGCGGRPGNGLCAVGREAGCRW